MKLAEALMERKAIKTKMEDLKKRIYQNSRIQEGEQPVENPLTLLDELRVETESFEAIVARINRTNNATYLSDDMTLMEAIVKKDMLNYLHLIHINLADKATPTNDRFSRREIKFIPAIDVGDIRKKADEIAQEYRLLRIADDDLHVTFLVRHLTFEVIPVTKNVRYMKASYVFCQIYDVRCRSTYKKRPP